MKFSVTSPYVIQRNNLGNTTVPRKEKLTGSGSQFCRLESIDEKMPRKVGPLVNNVPLNDLSRALSRDSEVVLVAINSVLETGHVILGPHVNGFESELSEFLDVKYVLGVASGTDALELAIKAVMPDGKNTVITAPNAGGYTSIAAMRAGYSLIYSDVDPQTMCITAEEVKKVLSPEVGVVVITHLYGLLTDFSDLIALCKQHDIKIVEDTAQAIGAHRNGVFAGTIADAGTTSFYPTKNLGALGDGGAVFTNSSETAERIKQLRQYGWSTKYKVDLPGGVNSRLDDMQAAILSKRLPNLQSWNERRREIISHYREQTVQRDFLILPAEGTWHSGHLAVVVSSNRDSLRGQLLREGIQTDIHFPIPDHLQPAWRYSDLKLPNAEKAAKEVFSLPCFPEMTDSEIEYVGRTLNNLS